MAGISNNANKAKSCAILSAEASRKKRGAGSMRTQRLKDSNSEDVDSLSSVHRRVAMTFSDYQFAALWEKKGADVGESTRGSASTVNIVTVKN